MDIDINENTFIRIQKIFNPIELVAEKESMVVVERDGAFEVHQRPNKVDTACEKKSWFCPCGFKHIKPYTGLKCQCGRVLDFF